ncbi:MAG: homoserine kinase [Chitinophagaceae bacterium]|nr:MAG: homoserine kinase [Chitinophagaceae bacterium]
MEKTITIKAPATIANLVCGFDILGLALEEPYDVMTLTRKDSPGLTIKHIDEYGLPEKPEDNVAGASLLALMEAYEIELGFELTIDKRIKPGSGLGSSAASAAGAVYAANKLIENAFSNDDLIKFAMNGEKVASGVKHADNITPCLLGGVTLIRSIHPLDIIKIDAPELFISVVHPQIEVKTSDARQILKEDISLKKAIKQWGNIAGLVAGLMQKDYALIGRSLEDVIIEPVRSILIPAFDEVKAKCIEAGALGGGISGSGPSIFMLNKDQETALIVEDIMKNIYTRVGIEFKTYVTKLNTKGITTL